MIVRRRNNMGSCCGGLRGFGAGADTEMGMAEPGMSESDPGMSVGLPKMVAPTGPAFDPASLQGMIQDMMNKALMPFARKLLDLERMIVAAQGNSHAAASNAEMANGAVRSLAAEVSQNLGRIQTAVAANAQALATVTSGATPTFKPQPVRVPTRFFARKTAPSSAKPEIVEAPESGQAGQILPAMRVAPNEAQVGVPTMAQGDETFSPNTSIFDRDQMDPYDPFYDSGDEE